MLRTHTSRARSGHRRYCLVNLREDIPDDNASLADFVLALVPIYGTKGGGRNSWKHQLSVMCDGGHEENDLLKACHSYARDGEVQLVLATHVDDLIWDCKLSAGYLIAEIKCLLILGTKDVLIFRYCGKEVAQDL